jgi:pSer/pThr/pTyr-binding forkhead associated (FHA) protein
VFTIGRSPGCDLPLGDPTVSWVHAELRQVADAWVLVDLGSKNGTRVNGWSADSGFIVRPGDCVRFGRAEFRLVGHW